MKFNPSKQEQLRLSFHHLQQKIQKIDDQEPNLPSSSSSTETVTRFVPPETSNLLSTADSRSSGHVDSSTTYAHIYELINHSLRIASM
jgi:hypothetical protein